MCSRKDHWQRIYTSKNPQEVSWYQKEPAFSLQMIRNSGIKKTDPIIDVGGGSSVLVDRLTELGYNQIAVLDISSTALDHAKNRLKDKAKDIEWIETDVTKFMPSQTYILWHDRAVFHFLIEKTDQCNYINVLKKAVPKTGHVIIASFALGGPTQCSGLKIEQYDEKKIQLVFGNEFKLIEQTQEIHSTPNKSKQEFSYFRFIRI